MDESPNQFPNSLLEKKASALLLEFGAGNATPGSGSAAALMGMLATRLISTVCKKSLEKPEFQRDSGVFRSIIDRMENEYEPKLRSLFEADAREFALVIETRRNRDNASGSNEKQKLAREANEKLENATDGVFDIAELCLELIDSGIFAFQNGWPSIRGDAGASISAALAGVMSALFVASLNLKTLKDRNYSRKNMDRYAAIQASLLDKQARALGCITTLESETLQAIQLDMFSVDSDK